MVALIMCPPLRPVLFPQAPVTPADSETQVFPGQPESQDSLTGAPEVHKGEAAEQEAKNWVDSVANVAIESAAAKYGQAVSEDPAVDGELIEPIDEVPATPLEGSPEDKTKKPIRSKTARGTDKAMRVVSDITDIYEQFAKYVVPSTCSCLLLMSIQPSLTHTSILPCCPAATSFGHFDNGGFGHALHIELLDHQGRRLRSRSRLLRRANLRLHRKPLEPQGARLERSPRHSKVSFLFHLPQHLH